MKCEHELYKVYFRGTNKKTKKQDLIKIPNVYICKKCKKIKIMK